MIAGGDGDGVNILHRQQVLVIVEKLNIVAADNILGLLLARFGKITNGDLLDVVGGGVVLLVLDVELALVARADVSHAQTVVGPGHVGGRRLVLSIDGRLEKSDAGGGGRGKGGFFDKFTARRPAVLGLFCSRIHNMFAQIVSHSIAV